MTQHDPRQGTHIYFRKSDQRGRAFRRTPPKKERPVLSKPLSIKSPEKDHFLQIGLGLISAVSFLQQQELVIFLAFQVTGFILF
jgi:hypothetical protein